MMGFIFGAFMGLGIGLLIGWHAGKDAGTTTIKHVTVKMDAHDLVDIIDAETALELLKQDTNE